MEGERARWLRRKGRREEMSKRREGEKNVGLKEMRMRKGSGQVGREGGKTNK